MKLTGLAMAMALAILLSEFFVEEVRVVFRSLSFAEEQSGRFFETHNCRRFLRIRRYEAGANADEFELRRE